MSQDDVDRLKKEIPSLASRIEQTRANLAIQSKYRDAAVSMARLYAPPKAGLDGAGREAELERETSERRCRQLEADLRALEHNLMLAQRRLLQHTAGILQLTHHTGRKPGAPTFTGDVPGSPESMNTYFNEQENVYNPQEDAAFDDRSLYLPLDHTPGLTGRPQKETLEIPPRSPVREQNSRLREETDRLKEQVVQLKDADEQSRVYGALLQKTNAEQLDAINSTERRLAELNLRLQNALNAKNQGMGSLGRAPSRVGDGSARALLVQLEYVENGLLAAAAAAAPRRKAEDDALAGAGARLATLNRQILDMLRSADIKQPPPAAAESSDLDAQLDCLHTSLATIDAQIRRAAELSAAATRSQQNNDQTETVLRGLWDIIQAGYAAFEQERSDRRQARAKGASQEDMGDDLSEDEAVDMSEPYSLQAFSARVQWMFARVTGLREQKDILRRQIKQQRDLNNSSDTQKDSDLRQKREELETAQALLSQREQEARVADEKLSKAMEDLKLQQARLTDEATRAKTIEGQARERDAAIASLESRNADAQQRLENAESNLSSLKSQLDQVAKAKATADEAAATFEKALLEKDQELERLNVMVIELKTEATIAKAELDGAYGSRAQRAAEAAALRKNSGATELQAEVAQLKSELASTLKEFEDMTKETIAAEKEKLELEGKLDDALATKAGLEAEVKLLSERLDVELGALKEQLDAERLKTPVNPGGAGSQRAGASMLSEQFRATMREERKKFQEELRVCCHSKSRARPWQRGSGVEPQDQLNANALSFPQEEQTKRRKLEEELRAMRRVQASGKSPLSPR